jgi:hypothetical protein
MSNLTEHAKYELERAGLFDKDSDYDGMLGTAALEIVEVFAKQGHSGFSASVTTELVQRLMRFEPLTPLTNDPAEWVDVSWSQASGQIHQCRRDPAVFSDDGIKTAYRLGEGDKPNVPVELQSVSGVSRG